MRDLIFLLIVIVFFILATLFVRGCDLISDEQGPLDGPEKR